MDVEKPTITLNAQIELAHQTDFSVGAMQLRPSLREVQVDGETTTLEPRVMQVLVALARDPGEVVSKDDLIQTCWDGREVGDDAISRCIAAVRRIGKAGGIEITTIPRVGYRLTVTATTPASLERSMSSAGSNRETETLPDSLPYRLKLTRRTAAGAAVVAAASAAIAYGGATWLLRSSPDSRAQGLYREGREFLRAGEVDSTRRAIELFKQAVAVDPDFAQAWAELALAYRAIAVGFHGPMGMADTQLVRSAAEQALRLDPGNADARLAQISIHPNFRHWSDREAGLRKFVRDYPDHWHANSQLAVLFTDVGRASEAIPFARRAKEIDPGLSVSWHNLAYTLNYAGQEQEADIILDQAHSRWPGHNLLWHTRFLTYLFSKRYKEAAAWARNPKSLPSTLVPSVGQSLADVADSLRLRSQSASAIEMIHRDFALAIEPTPVWAPILAALGEVSEAFSALEVYYFGGQLGQKRFAPPGDSDWRHTISLFTRQFAELDGDLRHASILRRIGLEDYWQGSGSQPDFRKG